MVVDDFTVDTVEQSVVDVGVVLAIDVSGSMNDGALDAAKAAAIDFVNQKKERTRSPWSPSATAVEPPGLLHEERPLHHHADRRSRTEAGEHRLL